MPQGQELRSAVRRYRPTRGTAIGGINGGFDFNCRGLFQIAQLYLSPGRGRACRHPIGLTWKVLILPQCHRLLAGNFSAALVRDRRLAGERAARLFLFQDAFPDAHSTATFSSPPDPLNACCSGRPNPGRSPPRQWVPSDSPSFPVSLPTHPEGGKSLFPSFPIRIPLPSKRANSNQVGTCRCPEPGALVGSREVLGRSRSRGRYPPGAPLAPEKAHQDGCRVEWLVSLPYTGRAAPALCSCSEPSLRRAGGGALGTTRLPLPPAFPVCHVKRQCDAIKWRLPSSLSGAAPGQVRALHGVSTCFGAFAA